MKRLFDQGKLAIITGSSQGLGKAFACTLLEAGGLVCLSDVNETTGTQQILVVKHCKSNMILFQNNLHS